MDKYLMYYPKELHRGCDGKWRYGIRPLRGTITINENDDMISRAKEEGLISSFISREDCELIYDKFPQFITIQEVESGEPLVLLEKIDRYYYERQWGNLAFGWQVYLIAIVLLALFVGLTK